jgi:hypothetical protein
MPLSSVTVRKFCLLHVPATAKIETAQGFVQHSLWADDADAEKKIWTDFLQILSEIRDPVLIHYGHYESTFLSRMRERYGGPPKGSASANAINAAVNLVSIIFARVTFPPTSMGSRTSLLPLVFGGEIPMLPASRPSSSDTAGSTNTCRH